MIMEYLTREPVSVSFPGLGINDLTVDPVAIRLGNFAIYWYGILIVLAFVIGFLLASRDAKFFNLTRDDVMDYILCILPSAIIGARIYYVIFAWDQYKDNFLSVFDLRNGGLAVMGGVLLSLLSLFFLSRKKKQPLSQICDFFVVYLALGQAIGRWGNFFNQEAFGTPTDLPWGMTSDKITSHLQNAGFILDETTADSLVSVHPTFLYESLACLALFFILYFYRKKSIYPWTTISLYFIGYGIVRFFIEGIRTDSLMIASTNLRISQLVSLVFVVIGLGLFIRGGIKSKKASASNEQ